LLRLLISSDCAIKNFFVTNWNYFLDLAIHNNCHATIFIYHCTTTLLFNLSTYFLCILVHLFLLSQVKHKSY